MMSRFYVNDQIGNRFWVEKVLSESDWSSVLVVSDNVERETVIMKIMVEPTMASEQLYLELSLLRKLNHPGIAKVYGSYELPEPDLSPALLMEYVKGVSLRQVLKSGPLPVERGLQVLRDVLETLVYLEEQKVLHRDLKPEHIILEEVTGHARLVDFGFARSLDEARTLGGTPGYIPPEVLLMRGWASNSDLYSIAVVFYEMFTGRYPFNGAIQNGATIADMPTPRHPCDLAPDLPRVVGDSILKAMSREPANRPASAKDWLMTLTPTLDNIPPYSPPQNLVMDKEQIRLIQNSLMELEQSLGDSKEEATLFNLMEQVRNDLKQWDGQGEIPIWNIC
jgi:eukaryotic-like serine/threonine-protein kinase